MVCKAIPLTVQTTKRVFRYSSRYLQARNYFDAPRPLMTRLSKKYTQSSFELFRQLTVFPSSLATVFTTRVHPPPNIKRYLMARDNDIPRRLPIPLLTHGVRLIFLSTPRPFTLRSFIRTARQFHATRDRSSRGWKILNERGKNSVR